MIYNTLHTNHWISNSTTPTKTGGRGGGGGHRGFFAKTKKKRTINVQQSPTHKPQNTEQHGPHQNRGEGGGALVVFVKMSKYILLVNLLEMAYSITI